MRASDLVPRLDAILRELDDAQSEVEVPCEEDGCLGSQIVEFGELNDLREMIASLRLDAIAERTADDLRGAA